MNIKKLLGKRIKEFRKSKGFTQEYVAEQIGIESTSISNIENGKYYPTAENLERIIKVLNVSPQDLFTIEHYQNNDFLLDEINTLLKDNPDKIRDFYKILKALIS